jgi:alanine-glyoxylate transaminase/serine-glyoxylate transaminase/serine-pyruvate transaminase
VRSRRQPTSFCFDFELLARYWVERPPAYHHTAPILQLWALHEALRLVLEEGLEERWRRHREAGDYFQAEVRSRGLELLADEGSELPQLTAIRVPDGVDGRAAARPARARDRGRRRPRANSADLAGPA